MKNYFFYLFILKTKFVETKYTELYFIYLKWAEMQKLNKSELYSIRNFYDKINLLIENKKLILINKRISNYNYKLN